MAEGVWLVRYTTDDATDSTPSWTTVSNRDVRSVKWSRGRESELTRVEAGTAELVLNNRTRSYDPALVTGLRPMNRWWIQYVLYGNLVTNGSFEINTTDWTGYGGGTISRSTLQAKFGSASLQVVAGGASQGAVCSLAGTLAFATYTYSAWIYSATGGSFFVQLSDGIDQGLSSPVTAIPAGVWTRIVMTGTADSHAGRAFYVQANQACTFYVDGAQVEQGWDATNYVQDGPPVIQDGFFGYAESYEQRWPATGRDAITIVHLADEFKVLALDKLLTTDPPRDTYQDLVMFDTPIGYWPMLYPDQGAAVVGEPLVYVAGAAGSGASVTGLGAIIGQSTPGFIYTARDDYYQTAFLTDHQSGDAGALSEFAIEAWISIEGAPTATELLLSGPNGIPSHTYTWKLSLDTARKLVFQVKNTAGTAFTITSATALTSAAIGASMVWYHVVATATTGALRLYINGTQDAVTFTWTGTIEQADNANTFAVGNRGTDIGASKTRAFDEIAFYRHALTPSARVVAHYNGGRLRGFPRLQDPGDRIDDVLDASTSVAARSIQTGTRAMTGQYMVGQSPLSEMRRAEAADAVDALLFIAADGTITFLADGHRSSSPYNTVQATFDDDGTDLPYADLTLDLSDAFIANEWNLTKEGGTTTTATDATSIARYGKRPQSLTDMPVTDDADVTSAAAAMLAKYKDPANRILSITLILKSDALRAGVLARDLGDRIRILRTQPGGGARIDQTSFIQKIDLSSMPGHPLTVTFGVSPL